MTMNHKQWAHVFRDVQWDKWDRYDLADIVLAALSEGHECSCYDEQYMKERVDSLEQQMTDTEDAIDILRQYITQVDEQIGEKIND